MDARTPSGVGTGATPVGAAEALHDVSNALTVVLGWLDEASREDVTPEELQRALAVATRKAREARSLAREAIGASQGRSESSVVDALVLEVVEALRVESARAGVTIAIEHEGPSQEAEVDGAAALGHVLTNLLLNAIAFSPAASTIRLSVVAEARSVRIAVADEGPGVDPNLVESLFEGRTSRPGGAGIGLRHAREMVRKLGGELSFVSTPRGATFELRLPRHIAHVAPSELPRRTSSSSFSSVVNGARVLVVEDDRAVCALLDAGLGARGAEVIAVHDEASLRARLPNLGAIDAVLLDLSPIASDVQGSLAEVRRALPDAGIVFISGSAVAIEEDLTAGDPRTRWVRKPFEVGEITQAIGEILRPRSR